VDGSTYGILVVTKASFIFKNGQFQYRLIVFASMIPQIIPYRQSKNSLRKHLALSRFKDLGGQVGPKIKKKVKALGLFFFIRSVES